MIKVNLKKFIYSSWGLKTTQASVGSVQWKASQSWAKVKVQNDKNKLKTTSFTFVYKQNWLLLFYNC